MLLSAFVRSSERPPLAFLAGWPYLLIGTVELTVAIWYLLPTLGLAGLLIHVGIGVPLLIVDALKSNHFGWNLVSLRANGFSDASVAFTVLFNLVASQGLTCLVFQYFGITAPLTLMTTTAAAESSPVGAWMGRAAAVAVNLCLTEAAFFVAHRELHLNPLLAPLHLMHHACRWASNTTNLLFHPLDLALEFAGPYLCLVGMHAFLWHDPITLFISIYIVQMWYAYDHDEYLRLAHFAHHTSINRNYAIYSRTSDASAKPDLVKQRLVFCSPTNNDGAHSDAATACMQK